MGNRVLHTGVTSDLRKRVYEDREKLSDGFTKQHNVTKLVYYEVFDDIKGAILREKQIKAGPRRDKLNWLTESIVNGMTYTMNCDRLPRSDKPGLAMTKGAKLACWRLWYPRLNYLSLLPVASRPLPAQAIGLSD